MRTHSPIEIGYDFCPIVIDSCVENKIELYGGPSSRHGNIRVCINGSWVMVCGYGNTVIDNNLASVVCSSIGYSAYGKMYFCSVSNIFM